MPSQFELWLDNTENDLNQGWVRVYSIFLTLGCKIVPRICNSIQLIYLYCNWTCPNMTLWCWMTLTSTTSALLHCHCFLFKCLYCAGWEIAPFQSPILAWDWTHFRVDPCLCQPEQFKSVMLNRKHAAMVEFSHAWCCCGKFRLHRRKKKNWTSVGICVRISCWEYHRLL